MPARALRAGTTTAWSPLHSALCLNRDEARNSYLVADLYRPIGPCANDVREVHMERGLERLLLDRRVIGDVHRRGLLLVPRALSKVSS